MIIQVARWWVCRACLQFIVSTFTKVLYSTWWHCVSLRVPDTTKFGWVPGGSMVRPQANERRKTKQRWWAGSGALPWSLDCSIEKFLRAFDLYLSIIDKVWLSHYSGLYIPGLSLYIWPQNPKHILAFRHFLESCWSFSQAIHTPRCRRYIEYLLGIGIVCKKQRLSKVQLEQIRSLI